MNDIAVINPTEELGLNNDQLIWMAEQAEKRVAAINSIMSTAIKMTTIKDWVNIGGNPYLMETGASKIARLFNISWQISPPVKEYDKDGSGHYQYRTSGVFSFAGAEISAEGLRSTHDEFFIGSAGSGDKPKVQKKPQDVDERDVMQAAYTNCLNNGIKRILPGLRNISIETLQDAGIDTTQMKGYSFNNGSQAEMTGEAKNQKSEIERMLREMCGDDKWTAGLKKITTFRGRDGGEVAGKDDINKLSEKMMPVAYGKVKTEYEMWVKEHGQPTDSEETTGSGSGENQELSGK